ncbi:DUF7130 family rubredoxin-like protein [Haloarchaeobius sp. HRN-SO-5]|uniref:DUF7130 family rubredoxin-like protein n=1 Tax=Haloarchaeobius sp. HRN-SO-5 TaxID=3446118 RepID=UPI003EC03237
MTSTDDQSDESPADAVEIDFGETVYTEDGDVIGTVRGVQEGGILVTTRTGVEALSEEHVRSGQSWGSAELMWRCMECGEMGPIEGDIPDGCPNCGTARENLMYWTED